MKISTYLTLIAAIMLCVLTQSTHAETTNEIKIESSRQNAKAFFNAVTQNIDLELIGNRAPQNVTVQLIDSKRNVVYDETFLVNHAGIAVEIPTTLLESGTFTLLAKGTSINFRTTIQIP